MTYQQHPPPCTCIDGDVPGVDDFDCPIHGVVTLFRTPGEAQQQPSITCPVCHRTSWHPQDINQGFCGYCHAWTASALFRAEEVEQGPYVNADDDAFQRRRAAYLAKPRIPWDQPGADPRQDYIDFLEMRDGPSAQPPTTGGDADG